MTELISRQAALAEIDKNREALLSSGMTGAEHILVHYGRRVIEELPTIDAVPVVRCKDCKNKEMCRTWTIWASPPPDDWFCKDGERSKE